MSIIKILPENLVNQIAAGEVVERPSSVMKELVENSLDSGTDSVVVDVRDGGATFIKVFDNGCGMAREDLEMAVQRHATSKISVEADLWKIGTMGFRGEALASIASVSKMTIRTKRAEDFGGSVLDCVAGEVLSIGDVGMSDGTQIEIHDLFFNTPARQKYLKQESTEFGHISGLLNTIALANPGISFKLIHNGKVVSDLPKVTDMLSRIADVFGGATADAMLPIFYGGSALQVDGYVGKPLLSRSTSQHQYIFVNGRPIQHHLMAARIKAAYHSMLMEHKKPVFILDITVDPALIDVNVHPRKMEIRFEDQESVIRAVYGAVKVALEKANLIPKGFTESRHYLSDGLGKAGYLTNTKNEGSFVPGHKSHHENMIMQGAMGFSRQILEERGRPLIKAITQIANSYIVAEDESGLVLIDQHAGHERVRYEELMNQYENQEKSVQPLLVPQQMEFTSDEIVLIEENKSVFERLGFEIEGFGGNTFVVHAVPSCLSSEDVDAIVKGVLDDISSGAKPSNTQGKVEGILTYMSCRSAIKFGRSLSLDEMQALISQMGRLKRPYTCPHGRPTMVSLSLSELEKMFGRK